MGTSPRIVLLGGGTGSFTLLQGLKKLTPNLTSIVNMSDDGGSTGVLRDELGVLPPGDLRQCLVALSDTPELRDLFSYRFSSGRLKGQSLGNIILSGLELQYDSIEDAIRIAGKILHIQGKVVPVTVHKHTLMMRDGIRTIKGQARISNYHIKSASPKLWLKPAAHINPHAEAAILKADMVVIAPGIFYASLLPIFSVEGVAAALRRTSARVVYITNLVNKPGHTHGWHVADYVRSLEQYLGVGTIDTVLYNKQPITDDLLKRYAAKGEYPVGMDQDRFSGLGVKLVGAQLVSKEIGKQDPADTTIRRTLIRHDPARVCAELEKLLAR